jgi:hypothetical protein
MLADWLHTFDTCPEMLSHTDYIISVPFVVSVCPSNPNIDWNLSPEVAINGIWRQDLRVIGVCPSWMDVVWVMSSGIK